MAAGITVRSLGRITAANSYFFLCDMQEKFIPSIKYFPAITTVASKMVNAAYILDIPVICTEQYPKGLGNTVADIDVSKAQVFSKSKFSMVIPEVAAILDKSPERKSVVLFGIETQVCVQQTCLDLLERGMDVHVLADGCSSRSQVDRIFALERLRQSGAFITTSESVLFELMGDSKHPNFKPVQALVKNSAPDSVELPMKRKLMSEVGELSRCISLKVKKLSESAKIPTRESQDAAGYDLYSAHEAVIPAQGKQIVKTDIAIAVPPNCYGRIAPRSGLSWKHHIDIGAGVVDRDYRGNVGVVMFNLSQKDYKVSVGDRIAQLILERIETPAIEEVQELDSTVRGSGGFGSTGTN